MSTATSDVRNWHGPLEVQVSLETILGLLAAFFIGFFTPIVLGIVVVLALVNGHLLVLMGVAPLMLCTGWLAWLIARLAADASMGRLYEAGEPSQVDFSLPVVWLPFALAMAARMPAFNWFWRPWIAAWWLAHFGITATIGHLVAMQLIRRLDVATVLVAIPLAIVVHFAFLFASNLYLVLAARAIQSSPRLCVRVWKYRFAIDLVIALLMLARGIR